jgi:hypothetical protein
VNRPFDGSALDAADGWEAGSAALAVIDPDGPVAVHGPLDAPRP